MGCDLYSKTQYDIPFTISIHAPIVGCDDKILVVDALPKEISIHAPIVGCDFIGCIPWHGN